MIDYKFIKSYLYGLICFIFIFAVGCETEVPPDTYTMSIAEIKKNYGRLVTVANMPAPNQNGTGDRLGLFRDETGTFWGLPLTKDENGNVIGCVPAGLKESPVTDTLPADTKEILGATNEPTNWRGGTGNLELMLRKNNGDLMWHSVKEAKSQLEPQCWSQSSPKQTLPYYRIVIAGAN